jgi:hypothetical protein
MNGREWKLWWVWWAVIAAIAVFSYLISNYRHMISEEKMIATNSTKIMIPSFLGGNVLLTILIMVVAVLFLTLRSK